MISAADAQDWSPRGRVLPHPGGLAGTSELHQEISGLPTTSTDPLVEQLKHIDISAASKEWWILRASPSVEGAEEELYVRGRTVVWSRGAHSRWITLRSFTSEYPVFLATWATFHSSPSLHQLPISDKDISFEGVCIVDAHNVSVFSEDGRDFVTSSLFPVSSVWTTKLGVLLEMESPDISNCDMTAAQLPMLYSMQHPYDETKPVVTKHAARIGAVTEPGRRVVYTNDDPSICMMFDTATGLHSVWALRKATVQESVAPGRDDNCYSGDSMFHYSVASSVSPLEALVASPMASTSISRNESRRHSAYLAPNIADVSTPTMSTSRRNTIHSALPAHRGSPARRHSLVDSLRESAASFSFRRESIDCRSPLGSMAPEGPLHPLLPEVCLDHLWTESAREAGRGSSGASRVFLSKDLAGQTRLCYLVPSRRELCMVRIEKTNKNEQLIFSLSYNLPALDAVPLSDLPMCVVLEPQGAVALYSGPQLVSKVFMPGAALPQIPSLSSHSLLSSSSASPASAHSDSFKYRRSSMRTECTLDGSYFADTSCILSPVPRVSLPGTCAAFEEHARSGDVVKLRDATSRRVTLEYSSGHMLRISLPEMHTSLLVRRCITTLQSVLDREIAMTLLVKWYCARNAPGSQDISPQTEWQLFMTTMLGLIGYNVEKLRIVKANGGDISSVPDEKRKKKSDAGSAEDWRWMITKYRQEINDMCSELGMDGPPMIIELGDSCDPSPMTWGGPLFEYVPVVLSSLHLLYEEMKLESLSAPYLSWLSQFLHLLASDLKLSLHVDLYWRDFPLINQPYQMEHCQISPVLLKSLTIDRSPPPSLFSHLYSLLGCPADLSPPFPYHPAINPITRDIVQLTGLLTKGLTEPQVSLAKFLRYIGPNSSRPHPSMSEPSLAANCTLPERVVMLMVHREMTRAKLEQLPASIALLLLAVVSSCRQSPPPDWDEASYSLVGREDLAALCRAPTSSNFTPSYTLSPQVTTDTSVDEAEDGMENLDYGVLSLRFPKDHRVAAVRRMLQSARPVRIALTQRPEVSDHDFIEEQEKQLYALCTRTMALPVGRGMFTLGSIKPVVLEPLPVPKLCLTGRSPVRGTTIDLSHIEVVPNMNLWPLFHNGVAAGLRVCPTAPGIDSTWIAYNKQKGNADSQTEHAGFLMALGLNGHLSSLNNFKIYEYLQKCHEMTSVGLLLGIAASKRGSSDQETIRTICLHIEAMLPPTSLELNIAPNIQVAALLGLGLLYQGSGHRHITEVLLSEIGRPPGPEMENCVDRESYSLAAGLALGLVVLGQGSSQLDDLRDLAIPDTLHHYMVGGHARQLGGSQRDKYRTPSYQIREGDAVNVHVTCPGATLALGMLYFRTGNEAVAGWMQAPDTQYLLDFVRPDFLLLRVLARGLILWDSIIPSRDWVESNVPASIKPFALAKPQPGSDPALDLETMNQAYCNILAGACMALGLRFAGSANNEAFDTLLHYAHQFTSLLGKSVAELAGKSTVEACTNVIVLSLAMVMAGTGEIEVLRLCRFLRSRVGSSHAVVTYGSHLATHMALGLLFLGGGRYTLSTSAPAVAALLCACFPKFPTHSNDNRYHLQAFRHLYVLAAEQRLLLPRCVDSSQSDYTSLRIVYLDTPWYRDQQVKLRAPCLLPEIHLIKEVHVEDDRYWPIVFERGRNWEQLTRLLEGSYCLPVKKKAGCLSYTADPLGFRTMFAQSLTSQTTICWNMSMKSVISFSENDPLVDFAKVFLTLIDDENDIDVMIKEQLRAMVYECCIQDKPMVLPIVMAFMQGIRGIIENRPDTQAVWHMKLLWRIAPLLANNPSTFLPLVSSEKATALYLGMREALDNKEKDLSPLLQHYCFNKPQLISSFTLPAMLGAYLTFYDFPNQLLLHELTPPVNPIMLMSKGLSATAATKLYTLTSGY